MAHAASDHAHDDVYTAALGYAARGWRVLPVHGFADGRCTCGKPECSVVGKHPSLLTGVRGATSDAAVLKSIIGAPVAFGARLQINIGLATGWESGFFVVDVDGEVGAASLRALEAECGALPATVESVTGGGGRHLLFAYPTDRAIGNKVGVRPKLDVRGDGGYIVAPPSRHRSGRMYAWAAGRAPAEIALATPPPWLVELCAAASTCESRPRGEVETTDDPRVVARARAYLLKLPSAVSGDGGHNRTFHVACVLAHGFGLAEDAAWSLLAEYNARCVPPWTEKELQRKLSEAVGAKTRHAHEFGYLRDTGPRVAERRVETERTVITVSLADVEPEIVKWLWYGRIAYGKLTLLDGDPGLGKSTLALGIAAHVSTGKPLPDHVLPPEPPSGVVIMSVEDGLADTIRPRLDAAGADVKRIIAVTGTSDGGLPTMPDDIMAIEAAVKQIDARLIIIDPLVAYLGQDVNAHKDQDVRRALAPLAAMAERTGAAVLVIRHLNKRSGEAAIYRGGGSIGIIGAARSALLLAKDPTDDTNTFRVLASTKCNIAKPPPSLRFTLAERPNDMTVVEWHGVTGLRPDDLMAPPPTDDERTSRQAAEEFLRTVLHDGPRESRAIIKEAKEAGHSERTLRRAREKICAAVHDPDGTWKWLLRDDAPAAAAQPPRPRKF